MTGYDISRAACAVTLPGLTHLAPILLMDDGHYEISPHLDRHSAAAARAWIEHHGDTFRTHNHDLITEETDP